MKLTISSLAECCIFNLKDHTSGLSESNFANTHRKKAIIMKQFTWQLMCENFKKSLQNQLFIPDPHTPAHQR